MGRIINAVQWRKNELDKLDREFRRNLINCVSGFKSANLIGTIDGDGQTNLAIFNSVTHIGANPPFMGLVVRPITVPRQTYNNIKETGYFTINSIHQEFYQKAHQTSANYPASLSEFDECGLIPEYSEEHPAPYVQQSQIKIGLELAEEIPIRSNGTILMVGKVIELILPQEILCPDGYLQLDKAKIVSIAGLDAYHQATLLARMRYARPGHSPEALK